MHKPAATHGEPCPGSRMKRRHDRHGDVSRRFSPNQVPDVPLQRDGTKTIPADTPEVVKSVINRQVLEREHAFIRCGRHKPKRSTRKASAHTTMASASQHHTRHNGPKHPHHNPTHKAREGGQLAGPQHAQTDVWRQHTCHDWRRKQGVMMIQVRTTPSALKQSVARLQPRSKHTAGVRSERRAILFVTQPHPKARS